jgi:hypothetical protein
MKPKSAPWRSVGSIPISVAIPRIMKEIMPQSRSAMLKGVPSKADIENENRLVRSDPELGRKLKTRATSQEPRFNGFWAVVVLPCHRLTQLRNTPASFVGSRFSVHFADRHVRRRIEKEWVEGNKDIL